MRYNLGCMDKYPIEAAGSAIENSPMYKVVFKKYIDPIKLEQAILNAFKTYPLFKTKVLFDHEYYLKDNNNPLIILKANEFNRPNKFGKSTNGYPFRVCYYEKELCFEWLHGITDGIGALEFLKQILFNYFNLEVNKSNDFLVASGLEPFFDKKEKGDNYEVDPVGFKIKDFKKIKRIGYTADCHKLVCNTDELINLAKICNTSFTPILAILYSQALRKHISPKAKNRNVACNIVLDLRRSLNYETMHNCIEIKRVTYTDEYDRLSFGSICKLYKDKLDNARKTPNIVRALTSRVGMFKVVHILPIRKVLKLIYKIGGPLFKDDDCNFTVSYPGKVELPKQLVDEIESMELKVWHDVGESVIAAFDYNGLFTLNITESFVNKEYIEDFISLAKSVGINFTYLGCSTFEQSHFEE